MKRTTKALLIGLATMVAFTMLVGCMRKDEKYVKYDAKVFDTTIGQRIYVDKETGVQYIFMEYYKGGALSVRLDADGKPMVDRSVRK